MKLFNLHTHTHFCDGKAEPLAYVKEALKQGFDTLGFSGHAPLPFENKIAIIPEELPSYIKEIRRLGEYYRDQINIPLALEFDFIPGLSADFQQVSRDNKLDYTIGSIHLIGDDSSEQLWFIDGGDPKPYEMGLKTNFNNNIRKAVASYFEQLNIMIETQTPDIIGHLDKIKMHNRSRFFNEDENWYQQHINETLALIKEKGNIIEVNTRGLYKKRSDALFPGLSALKKIKALNIPITISSDAHKPDELSLLIHETRSIVRELGFDRLMNFNKGWEEIPLF